MSYKPWTVVLTGYFIYCKSLNKIPSTSFGESQYQEVSADTLSQGLLSFGQVPLMIRIHFGAEPSQRHRSIVYLQKELNLITLVLQPEKGICLERNSL
jgi:hypothetical protein